MAEAGKILTRIGVFYDGNYFFHVSNYCQYEHPATSASASPGYVTSSASVWPARSHSIPPTAKWWMPTTSVAG